jgi:transposase, IS30 family
MGQKYQHLDDGERLWLFHYHGMGLSLREIGRRLGRCASTLSRELARNGGATRAWSGGYCPLRAGWLAWFRRARDKRFKLARQPHLQALVRDSLAMGWSPGQIAGRLAQDPYGPQISPESIYRWVYWRRKLKDWVCRDLPSRRTRRRSWRCKGRISDNRPPLSARPEAVAQRAEPGHWEVDTMRFRNPRGGLVIACERLSRKLIARAEPRLTAAATAMALTTMLAPLAPEARRSLTFDNGAECADHARVATALGLTTWFCPPHAPWTKGSVENAIGRLRRDLPRKTCLDDLHTTEIEAIISRYNATPRKCLGYRTPDEVFNETVALQM